MSGTVRPRIVDINQHLSKSLLTMIKQMPQNPMIRSQVHAALKFPIPEDRLTYEQIKDWIEYDWPAQKEAAIKNQPLILSTEPGEFEEPYPNAEDLPEIDVSMRYRYDNVGTCRYTEPVSGTGAYSITGRQIDILLQQSMDTGEDFEAFLGRVVEDLREMCLEDSPETESDGDTDYHDEESTDSNNYRANVQDPAALRQELRNWIRNYRPDHAGALRMTDL